MYEESIIYATGRWLHDTTIVLECKPARYRAFPISAMDSAVSRALQDKLYDKRKAGALE